MPDLYFAYGSNMSTARLQERIPGAVPHGAAAIAGHRLVCNKRGKDGSGKANLDPTGGHTAWGVLFEVEAAVWERLDRFEWGYERLVCAVEIGGVTHEAQLYLALSPDSAAIPPFDWYRDHCLRGAIEHKLPRAVVDEIAGWEVTRT